MTMTLDLLKKSVTTMIQEWDKLNHGDPGLVCSKFYPMTVDYLYIQFQLCRRNTLKHELKNRDKVDPAKSLQIFKEICTGVQVLHDNEMIHRDLKPANIFFSLHKGLIKIGDLGLVVMKGGNS